MGLAADGTFTSPYLSGWRLHLHLPVCVGDSYDGGYGSDFAGDED